MSFLFTSESVSEGHPDKMCDQISDAILDAALSQDQFARVAAECFTTTGLILVGGEITASAQLDVQSIARDVVKQIGYTDASYGFDYNTCSVMSVINKQSVDIAQGVNEGEGLFQEMGAGDQGMMFGYACNQTKEYMPLPISLAHKLMRHMAVLRKAQDIPYLRPDAKSQVTIEYRDKKPARVDTVVISTQHAPEVDHETIKQDVISKVIREVIPAELIDANTRYFINPTGRFVIGGPQGDTGLTGRKIIVDTYGGWGRHGGGAFSGKDATKVDRSGAYMARYIAKNLVAAGLADEIEVQISYAIGIAKPISVHVDSKGSAKIDHDRIETLVMDHFDLTPAGIIRELGLQRPVYRHTAAYGHFGRDDLNVSWEQTNKADILRRAAKL